MLSRMQTTLALLVALVAVSTGVAAGQAPPTHVDKQLGSELALDYTYLRSNAPPGGCACFNLNGGSATFAWPIRHGAVALVADATLAHASSVGSSGYVLTLQAYTAGARYRPHLRGPIHPFGQLLAGVAHSSGSLVEGQSPAAANSGAAFAANVGGGLDLNAGPRVSLRLVEAEYLVTTFDNAVNNHQNNLRLSAGLVFHFGK